MRTAGRKRVGIIAINLREEDELIDVVLCKAGDELVISSAKGQAIRFRQSDARPMGAIRPAYVEFACAARSRRGNGRCRSGGDAADGV